MINYDDENDDDDDDGINDVYTMINYKESLFVFSSKVTVIITIIIIWQNKRLDAQSKN